MARAMKDSGIEWIGQIPEELVLCQDLAQIKMRDFSA